MKTIKCTEKCRFYRSYFTGTGANPRFESRCLWTWKEVTRDEPCSIEQKGETQHGNKTEGISERFF